MSRRLKILSVLFSGFFIVCCASLNNVATTGEGEITVLCTYSDTIKVFAGVRVMLIQNGEIIDKEKTNSFGIAVFKNINDGMFSFRIKKRGYVEKEQQVKIMNGESKKYDVKMITLEQATIY
ncbi:hypothetical protein [Roseivirga sp. UBA1976]|jgi:hypothetical protein|uniref:hypothetical protein n=1 Tax=Roseivirga sp. UBA1976 TaxID=1947386 RepID=UPI00257F5688|nr:hypothetical protein [Roseivirga sp. UBA1976]MEC7755016.1 hypothetical protein [Bacteroidota bacterium]|tara:strand:- start:92 stop:457 length:366 start_codon:yes stop_codon:yes gene_type:complete